MRTNPNYEMNQIKRLIKKQIHKLFILSRKFIAPLGVPQGSHLGPLLFSIFINDLPFIIEFSKILLFADDIKLFLEISCERDCLRVQSDLNNIMEWCKANLLFLNFEKCLTISFSKHSNNIVFNYSFNSNSICKRVNTIKDLGIIFDSKVTFMNILLTL